MKEAMLSDGGERKEKPGVVVVGIYSQADSAAGVSLGEKILEHQDVYADKCLERGIIPMWVIALDDVAQRSLSDFTPLANWFRANRIVGVL